MTRKLDPDRRPHPGRTLAQRNALDAIGCGEPPRCSPKTIRALLDAGLIVDTGGEVRCDALGSYRIPSYAMPIPVHMQWCSAIAATDEEMASLEGLV
ncbi:hypothetical protein FV228_01350 [Methylobacterium sp. WL18]|uniref:hypothetical protein n=1 Tax=Methylobacterium sp. WL18 TaxID=2603897 RepID=UPI0011CC43F9|nr:hypothetical protein [Methylobacterium sp. WL18]TXN76172.1 hypothetical protein FV228_01350 [Methylobacterium sp. WL18]